jgi:phosphoserine phosphatase RsbU/P
MSQMFSNLLGNAVAHGSTDRPIKVHATTQNHEFELSVVNAGDPIPDAALKQLFQPFYRGAVRPSQQCLGLGLFIASEIARAHGGTLTADSSTEETRFKFRMPINSLSTTNLGYHHARGDRTASEGHEEQVGVCRDFAHLAVTLCLA